MTRARPMTRHGEAAGGLPSQRQLKVGEQLRHLLAEVFVRGESHDPRLAGVSLTVAEVRMSRDLRHATVYVSELGGDLKDETRAALGRAAAWLGGRAAREMNLKYAPKLHFAVDATLAEAERIERLLDTELGPGRRGAILGRDEGGSD